MLKQENWIWYSFFWLNENTHLAPSEYR